MPVDPKDVVHGYDVGPWVRRVGRPVMRLAQPVMRMARASMLSERDRRANEWVAAGYDLTLRQEYPLDAESLVFDLGGYQGQWASDIYARYRCQVWVFEPVETFAGFIARRFEHNSAVRVFPFGLSGSTRQETIAVAGDRSSTFSEAADDVRYIELVRAADFLRDNEVARIDLMKINIEGGEYELLMHLVDEGIVGQISDIQVQFHDFVPMAAVLMPRVREMLGRTHELTYSSAFVWENWRRR